MAKTISDEQMKLTMIINGDSAKKELFDLEKSTRSLNEQNKALLLQKKLLEKQGKKDTEDYKLLTATIKQNNAELTVNKNRMAELQKEIGLVGLTMGQLQSKATMLRNTLRNLVPGSEDFVRYQSELTQVNNRLGELSGRSRTAQSSIGSLADSFNRYQGMAVAAIATLTGVVFSIQKIIDINGKLSDAQTDVMKTTGMTKVEVDELAKSFGLLHTRTSRINLLGIAEQGGRIGIAKAEIGDFVNVMNKASVSLGDSFTGGAEEVANKLGKIKFLFEETKNLNVDQAYNSIGSAINDLGANGVASEANIADFTTRIGSLTDVLKPTIQQTLALGTAFEESGIESEVSARAYGIFMKQASTETAKFAKVMGLTQSQVENMINTNPLEFMLQFSEGMKGMNATDTAKTLDALGISADGANKVIGAMGNNTARFRELIDLSNNSFATGTSLITEYDIKNNNLAATYEKISKKVSGWFSSEGFNNFLISVFNGFAKLIGATEDADGSMTKWKNTLLFTAKIILIVTSALITNVGWQKLVSMWTTRNTEATLLYNIAAKARAFADGVGMVASQAYAMATMLMRGNLIGATQAFRVMTATMMSTPWGFLLGAIAAIGTAYVMFSDTAEKAETSQSLLNQTIKDTDAIVNQQTISLRNLLAVAQDETASKEARLAAIKKLNEISPEYLKSLTLENVKTAEGKILIDSYVKSLEKKAMLEVLQKRQSSIMEEMDKKKSMSLEEEVAWYDMAWASIKNLGNAQLATADATITASQRKTNALAALQTKLNLTNKEMDAFIKKNPSVIVDIETNTSSFNVPVDETKTGAGTGTKKNPNSTQAEINRLKLEEQLKYNEQTLKLSRQLEDDKITAMEDGAAKELIIENNRYIREIQDLDRQKVHADELAKIDEDIAKAKESKDITKYNALLEIRKGWDKKNADLDTQINTIKEGKLAIHNLKVDAINEKAETERIQKEQEQFDLEKTQRQTAFNNELNALNLTDEQRKKRQDAFDKKELAIQKKHLIAKITELKKSISEGFFSPEVQAKMEKQLAFLENAASLIADVKNPNDKSKAETIGDAAKSAFGETDVLGFTPTQWINTFDNLDTLAGKMAAVNMVVTGLQNIWSAFNAYQNASENAQLQKYIKVSDAKKNKLKKQLDSGMISQTQYNKQVQKIDDDLEKQKAEADYKQAKREKSMALVSAIINTAKGVAAALPNLFLSAIAATVGALQIATIAKQPLPAKGYETGLYGEYVKREQDGKTFKSSYQGKTRSGLVSKTSHFLVAENGPEMVIDNKAWKEMDPAVKEALIRNLQGIQGLENGKYNKQSMRYEVPAKQNAPSSNTDEQLLQMVLSVVSENTAIMKELRDKGVIGIMTNKDLKSMGYLQEGIDDYNNLRNKSKK